MVSQSVMGVDSQVKLCPLCQSLGRTGVLVLRQINIEEAIYVCSDNQCFYPVAVCSIEDELVKRHISEWDETEITEKQLENNTHISSGASFDGCNGKKHSTVTPHNHMNSQSCQPCSYGSSPQSVGHFGTVSYQGYALDGSHQTFSHFGTVSHQTSNGQQTIDPSYQQRYGTFGDHAAGQYGWPRHTLGDHLSYQGNQTSEDQQVDEVDSFINSLFQS